MFAFRRRIRRAPLLLALSLAICAYPSFAQPAPDVVTLRLSSSPVDDVTPVLYAQGAGLFRAAGLEVKLQRANSGAAVAAAVAGGAIDIGKSSVLALISAHVHGVRLVLVSPAALFLASAPLDGALVVSASSSVRSASDLIGKVVAVAAVDDLDSLSIKAWSDANGGDSKRIQFVEIPKTAIVAALEQGRVDAGMLTRPLLTQEVNSGRVRVLGNTLGAISSRFLESGWFADADYIAKNRDVVERFARVVEQASKYSNAHPAATVEMMAAFTGLEPAVIAHMNRMVTGTTLDAREIQPVIDLAARYKVIPSAFDARELINLSSESK